MSVTVRRLLIASGAGAALAALFALGLALMLSGPRLVLHTSRGFTPAEVTLPRCTDRTPIVVADLVDQPRSTCDPTGVELILPDGHTMTVPPPLAAHAESTWGRSSGSGPTYSTVNFGIYGVCVAERSGDNKRSTWWGRAEAVTFCQEGDDAAPTNWG